MVKSMRPGSVLVDVAIDQGACIATMDRVTTHKDPVFVKHGVIHYAVANMPGAVPRTSTFALTNATMPYALQLANKGWHAACRENAALAKGVNTANGACTYAAVAEAQNVAYTPIEGLL
jgi:alanine dehydrogenase